ncbi:MAG TPA: ferritin-like domain-containing protein [Ferruginibacter sp.]|nr:ferritin-like domain-containing protein [Ferruginibacter sp.]
MAKSPASRAKPRNTAAIPAAFAKKDGRTATPSKENASKYAPTKDAAMKSGALDPEDGVLKLFTDSIKDLYWAENQLIKALPKMAKAAGEPALSKAILDHLKQTKGHAERLEKVFALLGKKVQAKKCDAMEGLTKEGEGIIEDTDPGTAARDLGIIMASQKVEHYEISAYTGLVKLAGKLGLRNVSDLLSATLAEEVKSDETLGNIADKNISFKNK